MARRRPRRAIAPTPPAGRDDFQLIKGIGPAMERRLHEAGIHSYAQLAALSHAEIAQRVAGVSLERVSRLKWNDQARKRLARQAPRKMRDTTAAPHGRAHYATFIIDVLLDEKDRARRTKATHVQSGAEGVWAGWDEAGLAGFLRRRSAMHAPRKRRTDRARQDRAMASDSKIEAGQMLRLTETQLVPSDSAQPRRCLPSGQPFEVRGTLDFDDTLFAGDFRANCIIALYARCLGGRLQYIGEAHIAAITDRRNIFQIAGRPLSPGMYRLQAVVAVAWKIGPAALSRDDCTRLAGDYFLIY